MSARWWTLGVWALAAASALFWGLRLFVRPLPAPPQTQLAEPAAGLRGDLTRLLGADPPPPLVAAAPEPAADARFALIGVVSPRAPQAAREGVALIAVDGKPPRAYRVGALVDGQNRLQSVHARGATLGPGDGVALIALTLAPPAPASTGSLPTPPLDGEASRAARPGLAAPRMPRPGPLPQVQGPQPSPLAAPVPVPPPPVQPSPYQQKLMRVPEDVVPGPVEAATR